MIRLDLTRKGNHMTEPSPDKQKQLAVLIADNATNEEKEALRTWIEKMLAIKASDLPAKTKATQSIAVTRKSKVLSPSIKLLARELKRLGWDERSLKARVGIAGVGLGVLTFGSQAAGVAAFGGAIAVPLWVLFGAGATFLGFLYEEITGKHPNPKTTYNVIDADKDKDSP